MAVPLNKSREISSDSHAAEFLEQQYESVMAVIFAAGLLAYAIYLVLFIWFAVPRMALANLTAIVALLIAAWLLHRSHLFTALFIAGVTNLFHSLYATTLLGWNTDFHMFGFIVLLVLLMCPILSRTTKLVIFVILMAAYAGVAAWLYGSTSVLPIGTIHLFRILNSITFAAFLAFVGYTYAEAVSGATRKLHALNSELTRLATTDALTGLVNRRQMREFIEREITRFKRSGRMFAVILADIDHFKSINDKYGHQTGDVVLIAVANAMREVMRAQDQLARWGGEEFLVLLPETSGVEALAAAQRLQERLVNLQSAQPEMITPITLTYGIAHYRPELSADGLLLAADRALYRGKALGRDRVVMDE